MARTATAGFWSRARARARSLRRRLAGPSWLAAGLILTALVVSEGCRAEPVKGEARLSAAGGYARLVLKLADDVESEVTTAGSILVIRFKQPVDIPIEKLSDAVPDYVGSVRRDPDGTAIRLSLVRRVTVNTMTAGERVFVDLLPELMERSAPQPSARGRPRTIRARARRGAHPAPAARGGGGKEASAHSRARVGTTDLRPFRVRNA